MKTFVASALVASFVLMFGCSNTIDEADNAVDCNDVCNKYKTCKDLTFNTDTCAKSCRDQSNEVKDFQRRVNACDSCLDAKACTEISACATDCAGIIPST